MSINLIIISRYNSDAGNQQYINNIKSLNLAAPENTNVVYPSDTIYETTLVSPLLKIEDGVYNLIIYDWSTTLNSSINANISTILTKTFDVAYLGKYLDTCNNYSPITSIGSFTLVSGTEPVGFNALVMNKSFSEKIQPFLNNSKYYSVSYAINSYKIENEITELATSPNLFVYNPLYNAVDLSNVYNIKTEECQGITSQIVPPSDNSLLIFWIIIIIIGICLIFWIVLNFTTVGYRIQAHKDSLNV
jgi:hypothetical protein